MTLAVMITLAHDLSPGLNLQYVHRSCTAFPKGRLGAVADLDRDLVRERAVIRGCTYAMQLAPSR